MQGSPILVHGVGYRLLGCTLAAILCAGAAATPAAADPEADAKKILKDMSDYMAGQKNLSSEFDVALDVITPSMEKLKFTASGEVQLVRPDKVHFTRKGGYSDVALYFDGQTATIVDRYHNNFARLQADGTVDKLIDTLRNQYFVEMPGADLLLSRSFDELMDGVVEARDIGLGVIGGVDCRHLAFRNADTDWQVWVRTGDAPLPCKYVITSKTVAAAPEYSVTFRNWRTEPVNAAAFTFTPTNGARSVAFADMASIGELPSPTPYSSGAQR